MQVVLRMVCVATGLLTLVGQVQAATAGHLLRSATTPSVGLEQRTIEEDMTGSIRARREPKSDITSSIKRKRAPAIRPVQPANPATTR
jgi:hypothetical protein